VLHLRVVDDRRQGAFCKSRGVVPLGVRTHTAGDDLGNPVPHQTLGGVGPGIHPGDRGVPIELRDGPGVRLDLRGALFVHGEVNMGDGALGGEQHVLSMRDEVLFDGLLIA
jgi:hypothetical protein